MTEFIWLKDPESVLVRPLLDMYQNKIGFIDYYHLVTKRCIICMHHVNQSYLLIKLTGKKWGNKVLSVKIKIIVSMVN
ncbi:hypothetical protein DERP_006157 [Dermatophagoides pteronyssinus]|uniref:Uncharacterized protein n=1 Tax=Dermatophagoides pteronyssinus TaxID=6956 RepID=A0ABQ8JTG8_DERPT|nr:hypothetical protein DERP_006157 [Dermatophagoides pteronyssinus]